MNHKLPIVTKVLILARFAWKGPNISNFVQAGITRKVFRQQQLSQSEIKMWNFQAIDAINPGTKPRSRWINWKLAYQTETSSQNRSLSQQKGNIIFPLSLSKTIKKKKLGFLWPWKNTNFHICDVKNTKKTTVILNWRSIKKRNLWILTW